MLVSLFSKAKDVDATTTEVSLSAFVDEVQLVEGIIADDTKENGGAWSPAVFKEGRRNHNNVEQATVLAFDFDRGTDGQAGVPPAEVEQLFDYIKTLNANYAAHESFSSGFCRPRRKFRVVFELATPVSPDMYMTLWDSVVAKLPVKPDSTKRHPGGIFFSPRIPAAHKDGYWTQLRTDAGPLTVSPTNGVKKSLGLNQVKVGGGKTEAQWIESLKTCQYKHQSLNDAALATAKMRLRENRDLGGLREALLGALLDNNSSEPVKDWNAAGRTVEKAFKDATRKLEEENQAAQEQQQETAAEVNAFEADIKHVKKAQAALNAALKELKSNPSLLSVHAENIGRFCPHVLSNQAVLPLLVQAVTTEVKKGVAFLNASDAENLAIAGLQRGMESPRFIKKGWQSQLLVDAEERPLACDTNARLLLLTHPAAKELLRHDVRLNKPIVMREPPWETTATAWPAVFEEHDSGAIELWMSQTLTGRSVGTKRALEAVILVAREDPFDPFQDYLESLTWDGNKRLHEWLSVYAGVEDTEYTRMISVKFLLAAVARTYTPNCPADTVLVLQGAQGAGKSRLVRALLPEDRYLCDYLSDIKNKDTQQLLSRCVIIEVAEMQGFNKKQTSEIKDFISGRLATVRHAYGRLHEDVQRRAIFVATTNEDSFLRDETGARRFWPVCVGDCRPTALEEVREQLWAEAVVLYRAGEVNWLTHAQEQIAALEQEKVRDRDELEAKMLDWLNKPLEQNSWITEEQAKKDNMSIGKVVVHKGQLLPDNRLDFVTVEQVCTRLGLDFAKKSEQMRISGMLKANHFKAVRVGDSRLRCWQKK